MTHHPTQHETKNSEVTSRGNEYHEHEYKDTLWNHPYFLYIILTVVLFLVLGVLGWLAWENDWIPRRGVTQAQN